MNFYFYSAWFDVHDTVKIVLVRNLEYIEVTGSIVSKKVLYPSGYEDMKLAVCRYSICFSDPIAMTLLDYYKDEERKRV